MLAACLNAQTLEKHEWKVTLKVVDESGNPIAGAIASVGYFDHSQPASIDGLTDSNGVFMASQNSFGGELGFSAKKPGYYPTREPSYNLDFDYKSTNWNPTPIIVLKKIGNPVPMYAKNARVEIPVINIAVGFDLEKGDWVSPFGAGVFPDLIFQAQRRWAGRHDFDCSVKITFSNQYDGLVPVSVPLAQGSDLRMAGTAPETGYIAAVSRSLSHTPAAAWVDNESQGNRDMNYYIRVRSSLDPNGNVRSALYGKIYGDFALDPMNSKTLKIFFTYYLNPQQNSRDVEYNPTRDLFKNLSMREEVREP